MSEEKLNAKCYCGTDLFADCMETVSTQVATGKEDKPEIHWITYCKNRNCPNNFWMLDTLEEIKRLLQVKDIDLRK